MIPNKTPPSTEKRLSVNLRVRRTGPMDLTLDVKRGTSGATAMPLMGTSPSAQSASDLLLPWSGGDGTIRHRKVRERALALRAPLDDKIRRAATPTGASPVSSTPSPRFDQTSGQTGIDTFQTPSGRYARAASVGSDRSSGSRSTSTTDTDSPDGSGPDSGEPSVSRSESDSTSRFMTLSTLVAPEFSFSSGSGVASAAAVVPRVAPLPEPREDSLPGDFERAQVRQLRAEHKDVQVKADHLRKQLIDLLEHASELEDAYRQLTTPKSPESS